MYLQAKKLKFIFTAHDRTFTLKSDILYDGGEDFEQYVDVTATLYSI